MSKPPEKEYGLIIPNKNKKATVAAPVFKKPSIFESDSDSDDSGGRPTGISVGIKRQDREIQNKAIEEDPTIYQYDELYDDMEKKRKESKLSRKDLDKKPKYINNLLKAAEKRKIENERRIERQVQREREAEGNEFKDKEQFVTASYKKKLEEMRKQEELEKREEYLEAIGDVTKQANLDGFYRHLYEQNVNYDEEKEKKMEGIKTTILGGDTVKVASDCHIFAKPTQQEAASSKSMKDHEKQTKPDKKRHYRKRSLSKSDESEEEINIQEKSHLPSNLDADSDFSIDSESESDSEPKAKNQKVSSSSEDDSERSNEIEEIETNGSASNETESNRKHANNGAKKENVEDFIESMNVWEKRTVGAIFDAAVQRYYERRAMRLMEISSS